MARSLSTCAAFLLTALAACTTGADVETQLQLLFEPGGGIEAFIPLLEAYFVAILLRQTVLLLSVAHGATRLMQLSFLSLTLRLHGIYSGIDFLLCFI